jgi:uncharacterized protein YndB with AHSA1/START domain
MKDLKLTVTISRNIQDVFEFTTNPINTPKWIESLLEETADIYPPVLGTVYKNKDKSGSVNEYIVTQYDTPNVFQLDAVHQDYKVRYTYRLKSENETELEYYEWSELGQLHSPFIQEILDNLKVVMESRG